MGFLGKIKAAATALVGGGAKVTIEAPNPSRQAPFHVKVAAVVGDNDLKIGRVYVKVEGVESTTVKSVEIAEQSGSSITTRRRDVSGSETIFQTEVNIAPGQTLTAKQTYNWEADISLPAGALPTYVGRNARHEWRILAGLDASGKDPDSGWVSIIVT